MLFGKGAGMSERSERRKLRAEARSYGMIARRGATARELDKAIQEKVGRDFRDGICSRCNGKVHWGAC